jgi:DNA-binding IclR family transcriptional regulator
VAALNVVAAAGRQDEKALTRDFLPLLLDAARQLRGML